jgi:hypothetical protein
VRVLALAATPLTRPRSPRRIGQAQDRIQALRGDAKPTTVAEEAPAPKAKKAPKDAPEPKAKQPKAKQPKAKQPKANGKPKDVRSEPESVAPAASYSAEFTWCQFELPVGAEAGGTRKAAGPIAAGAGGSTAGFGTLIAGGKCSESAPGGNEFVAWETQPEDEAARKAKAEGQAEAAKKAAEANKAKAAAAKAAIDSAKAAAAATEAKRAAAAASAPAPPPQKQSAQAEPAAAQQQKAEKAKKLADASLDSPNTRKKRQEIMVRHTRHSILPTTTAIKRSCAPLAKRQASASRQPADSQQTASRQPGLSVHRFGCCRTYMILT